MKMEHKFTNSVILRFTTILLILMIVSFTLLLIGASSEIRTAERDSAAEFLGGNLKIIVSTTDNLLRSIATVRTGLLTDPAFTRAVMSLAPYDTREEYPDFKAVQTIKSGILNAAIEYDAIESVYLYCAEADRLFISNVNWNPDYNKIVLEDTAWFRSHAENLYSHPWNITRALENEATILSSYFIIGEYGLPMAGLLSVNVSPSVVLDSISEAELGANSGVFVMDAYGNTLFGGVEDAGLAQRIAAELPASGSSGTFDVQDDEASVLAAYQRSQYSGFTFVAFMPQSQIQSVAARIANLSVWYVAESVLVVLISFVLVYFFFFKPIRALANGMQRFERGDFSVRMPVRRLDEIGLINRQFNEMTANIERLIQVNYVNELAKRDIQLKLTQNQINEHFLYNTLDSIHWLAKQNNTPDISAMINALANFYRASLSNGKDIITIGEIGGMIGSYLYLQRIRFGDSLSYELDFDESLKDILIPKHLFLPLVENAIGHGLRGMENGMIKVSLHKIAKGLKFSVSDNGHGIPSDRLDEIYAHMDTKELSTGDSFALRNINTQLELYFGNTKGVQIDTAQGAGATVWFDIDLPKEGEGRED